MKIRGRLLARYLAAAGAAVVLVAWQPAACQNEPPASWVEDPLAAGQLKPAEKRTIGDIMPGVPLPQWVAREPIGRDLRLRPFLYWRQWANQPVPPFRAFLFLFLTSVAAWAFLPVALSRGRETARGSFWKSLLVGFLTVAVAMIFVRALFLSEIGGPLAVLTLGVVQLALTLGFAVIASLLGQSLLARTGAARLPWLAARPVALRVSELAVGAALASLLFLLPGAGPLPPVGTRLVMLLAILGAGALLKAWFASRSAQ